MWTRNKQRMEKYTKPLIIALVSLCMIFAFFLFAYYEAYKNAQSDEDAYLGSFKCPEEYPAGAQRTEALRKFNDMFMELNPRATVNDFATARIDFYIGYNCKPDLEQYGWDGTSTIDSSLRAKLIQNMIENLQSP